MSDADPITNTKADSQHLCLTIDEYRNFAEAVNTQCYLNRDGQLCKLKNAKTKKLKNLRYTIRKSEYLLRSMIWQAQLHFIEMEIKKRQGVQHYGKP